MILFKGKTNDLETLFPPTLKLDGQICVRNGISAAISKARYWKMPLKTASEQIVAKKNIKKSPQ